MFIKKRNPFLGATRRKIIRRRVGSALMGILIAVGTATSLFSPFVKAEYPIHAEDHIIGKSATLDSPKGLAVDSQGNVFVSDYRRYVKKLSGTGLFITQFGNLGTGNGSFGSSGVNGIAVDALDNVYVADISNKRIQKFSNTGTYMSQFGTAGTGAGQFGTNGPGQIAIDSFGNIFVSDSSNKRIQKFSSAGVYTSQFGTAGTGNGQFGTSGPNWIAIDSQDNVYVSDRSNYRVQKFTNTGAYILRIGQQIPALYCPAAPAMNSGINGIAIDSLDNVYVAAPNTWCNPIYKFSSGGVYLSTIKDEKADSLIIGDDDVLYAVVGTLWISGRQSYYAVRTYSLDGTAINSFGTGRELGHLRTPGASAQDAGGNTYVVDRENFRIQKFDSSDTPVLQFGTYGTGNGQLREPSDIAIDSSGNVFITDTNLARVQKFDSNGNYLSQFGVNGTGPGQFDVGTKRIGIDSADNIYVVDGSSALYGRTIQKFTSSGVFLNQIGVTGSRTSEGQINQIDDIFVNPGGSVHVLRNASSSSAVLEYDAEGAYSSQFPTRVSSSALVGSNDLARDSYGNFYIIDINGKKILLFRNDGKFVRQIAQFEDTRGSLRIMVNSQDVLYVGDTSNDSVRVFSVTSIINSPSAPLNLAHLIKGDGHVELTWDTPLTDNGSAITGYKVEYLPYNHGEWITAGIVDDAIHIYELDGILDDTYDIRVSAENNAGFGTAASNNNITVQAAYMNKQIIATAGKESNSIAFDSQGNYYVADWTMDQVTKYNPAGVALFSFGQYGTGDGQFAGPQGIAVNDTDVVFVGDAYNCRVQKFTTEGIYLGKFGSCGGGDGQFYYNRIQDLAFDSTGYLYVVDLYNRVGKYTQDGVLQKYIAADVYPTSIAFNEVTGEMFIANSGSGADHGVMKYDASGAYVTTFGSRGEGEGQFYDILGLAIDSGGNIIVADTYNYRIQILDSNGTFKGKIGHGGYGNKFGQFNEPNTVRLDADGNLYVPDPYSNRILSFSSTGVDLPVATVPSQPQSSTSSSPINNSLYVQWSAPLSDGNSQIVSYIVEHRLTGSATWTETTASPSSTAVTITGVAAGTYEVRVSVSNAVGRSQPTSISPNTTVNGPTASSEPTPPQRVTALSNLAGTIATNWTEPVFDNGSPISAYIVEYQVAGSSGWTSVSVTPDTREYTIAGLATGSYTVQVSAMNAIGSSAPVSIENLVVLSVTRPTPVQAPVALPDKNTSTQYVDIAPAKSSNTSPSPGAIVTSDPPSTPAITIAPGSVMATISPSDGSVSVTWPSIVNGTISPSGYVIEVRTNDTSPWLDAKTVGPNELTGTLYDLAPDNYQIRVSAVYRAAGERNESRIVIGFSRVDVRRAIVSANAEQETISTRNSNTSKTGWLIAGMIIVGGAMLFILFFAWKKRNNNRQQM